MATWNVRRQSRGCCPVSLSISVSTCQRRFIFKIWVNVEVLSNKLGRVSANSDLDISYHFMTCRIYWNLWNLQGHVSLNVLSNLVVVDTPDLALQFEALSSSGRELLNKACPRLRFCRDSHLFHPACSKNGRMCSLHHFTMDSIFLCVWLWKRGRNKIRTHHNIFGRWISICHHSTRVLTPTVATLSNQIQPYPTIPNHRSVHIGLAPKPRLEIDMAGDVDGPEDLVHQVASSSRDWHPVAERRWTAWWFGCHQFYFPIYWE